MDVLELSKLDAEALRELCSELLALTKALEQRVAALESLRQIAPTVIRETPPRHPYVTGEPLTTSSPPWQPNWVVSSLHAAPHHVTRDLMSWSN